MYYQGKESEIEKARIKANGGTVYRQSNVRNYFICPKSFQIAQSLPEDVHSSLIESRLTAMGLLFEGYALGFKGSESDIKGVGADVKSRLVSASKYLLEYPLKDILPFHGTEKFKYIVNTGTKYFNQLLKRKDYYISGEADIFHSEFGFWDIKHTEELNYSGWNGIITRESKLQCIHYPYMRWKGTKELHDFYYVCVESKMETPIIRIMHYRPTEEDFEWFEEIMDRIHEDPFFMANTGDYGDNCLNQRYGKAKGRCKYLGHCDAGKSFLGGFHELSFKENGNAQ